jgi:hypothetical protein
MTDSKQYAVLIVYDASFPGYAVYAPDFSIYPGNVGNAVGMGDTYEDAVKRGKSYIQQKINIGQVPDTRSSVSLLFV